MRPVLAAESRHAPDLDLDRLRGLALRLFSRDRIPLAEKSVQTFHQQLNAAAFDRIYADASQDMKAVTPQPALVELLAAVHRKLSVFQSGKTLVWNDNVTTGGHFLTLTYASTYSGGAAALSIASTEAGRSWLAAISTPRR